jgi:hypothetical protein
VDIRFLVEGIPTTEKRPISNIHFAFFIFGVVENNSPLKNGEIFFM